MKRPTISNAKFVIILFVFIVYSNCSAQDSAKFNLDFENYLPVNNLSEGWFKWGNYDLSIDSLTVYSGKYAAKIKSYASGSSFGSIAYKIPARYEGRSIQLEGYMKIQNVENGFAGLLLRIDGNGTPLVFDNMQSQSIAGTRNWQKYIISLSYPERADFIYVAGILAGKGEAWFDHFTLTIDGHDIQTLEKVEKPIYKANLDTTFNTGSNIIFPELNEELIKNLELLGRIWGFLKYHHPEPGKGSYNWDYELFRMLPDYLKVENVSDRNHILLNWIEKYGDPDPCADCKPLASDAILKPDHSWINQIQDRVLANKLNDIYDNRHQGNHFYIFLTPNVGNPQFQNECAYANMPYPDDGFRLLALYKYWNIIQYFYPNRHLTDKDWNQTLKEYIPIFISAKNELEYELAAIQMIGDIKDTHANLWGGKDKIEEIRGSYHAPFQLWFIEDNLVVTDYYNPELKPEAELEIGDIITHIDLRPIDTIVDSLIPYYPASNNAARLRDISADLLRSTKNKVNIKYFSDGQNLQKELTLYPRDSLNIYHWYRREDEKSYKLLDGNIGYITLKNIQQEDIEPIKETFKDSKGIIIDIRNYPSTFVPFSLGSYFVSETTPFAKFTNGNVNNPGEFTFTQAVEIPPDPVLYQGKLVVLLNEISQSQAEYTAMAFRAGENTTIIGSTSAGADGNVSTILLPGGLRTMISGIGVYFPDGTETQRVGIVPDIEVKPTIEGIKKGRDELLEKAIELIQGKTNQESK